jgi:UDP-GlcNAc:undecaprenyl-phosphate GlcNAc-1-phosphate transferase
MKYFMLFIVPFLLSLALTPLVKFIATKVGIVAKPKEDRWHNKVVPLLGGVSIYVSFLVGYLLFLPKASMPLGLIVGVTSIFILGLIDDIKGLSPQNKIIGQIICASLAIMFGVIIKIIEIPVVAIPLTILWMVGIANAFNLLDNMDGLSSGVAVIATTTLFVCSLLLKNYEVAAASLVLIGATLGFLPYNFYPAKIFMGDCGAMFIGFTLACLTVEGTWKQASNLFIVLFTPVLALAVPIFDTVFVTITRKIDGVSIAKGGKDHTSHRLVFLGLPERKAVIILYVISAAFGLAALASLYLKIYISAVMIALLLISFFAFGIFLSQSSSFKRGPVKVKDEEVPYYKDETALVDALIQYKRVILEILCDLCLICIAYLSSYIIRYEGVIDSYNFGLIAKSLPIIIALKLGAFFVTGIYGNFWRYFGLSELLDIAKGIFVGSIASVSVLLVVFRFKGFSRMIFLLDAMILLILMAGVRIAFRLFREHLFVSFETRGRKILIAGAGDTGDAFLREIRKNKGLNYRPVGFIDDDFAKLGRRIQGVKVLGTRTDIPGLVKEKEIDEIIIAMPSVDRKTIENIAAICRESGVAYREISGIFWK